MTIHFAESAMDTGTWKGSLTLVAAVIAAIAAIVGPMIISSREKKSTYINIITANRIAWMQEMRDLFDRYLRKTQVSREAAFSADRRDRIQYFDELSSLRNQIYLMLNYNGYLDREIIGLVNNIYQVVELFHEIVSLIGLPAEDRVKYLLKHYGLDILENMFCDVDFRYFQSYVRDEDNNRILQVNFEKSFDKVRDQFNKNFSAAPKKLINEVETYHNKLIKRVQIYLKLEWERVKQESQGKTTPQSGKAYEAQVDRMIDDYLLKGLYDYRHCKLPDYLH